MNIKDRIKEKALADQLELVGDRLANAAEAEAELVALVLSSASTGHLPYDEASQLVSAQHFGSRPYRALWAAIGEELAETQQLSRATLILRLRKQGAEEMCPVEELDALLDLETTASATVLAQRIADAHGRRAVQTVSATLLRDGSTMSVDEMRRDYDAALDELSAAQGCAYRTSGADIAQGFISKLRRRALKPERAQFRLGFGLDYYIPARFGCIYHICGHKKGGKTTAAIEIAAGLIRNHGAVLDLWSVEMTRDETEDALVAALTGLSRSGLESGELNHEHEQDDERKMFALEEALGLLQLHDVQFNNTGDITPQMVASMTNVRHAMHRERIARGAPHVVIVDYLQGLQAPGRFNNRTERIEHISKALRSIAKTERIKGVPPPVVIALCHTGRGLDGFPTEDDIFGSDQPAKDTDGMAILSRPGMNDADPAWHNHTDVNVCLNRRGGTGRYARATDFDHLQSKMWQGETYRQMREREKAEKAERKGGYRG